VLIAIPKEGSVVCAHFGHCEQFALFNTETGVTTLVDNPGHVPGVLPGFLKSQGVQVVIAGGMGQRAQELFVAHNIELIVGVTGEIDEVIKQYQAGMLKSTGAVCSEHAHAGDCHH